MTYVVHRNTSTSGLSTFHALIFSFVVQSRSYSWTRIFKHTATRILYHTRSPRKRSSQRKHIYFFTFPVYNNRLLSVPANTFMLKICTFLPLLLRKFVFRILRVLILLLFLLLEIVCSHNYFNHTFSFFPDSPTFIHQVTVNMSGFWPRASVLSSLKQQAFSKQFCPTTTKNQEFCFRRSVDFCTQFLSCRVEYRQHEHPTNW